MSDLNLGLIYSLDDKDLEEIKEKVLDEVYENQLSSDNINENLLLLKKQNDPELYKKTLVVKQLLNSKTIIKDDKNKGFLITDQDELRNAKKRSSARAAKKALLENLKNEKENTHVQRKINSYSEEQKRKWKREQLEKNGVSSLIEQCRNNYNSKIQDEDFKRSSNYDFGDR